MAVAGEIVKKETKREPAPVTPVVPDLRSRQWEFIVLGLIVALAEWLRFSHFNLLEFQGDEAYGANLALQAVKAGHFPLAGLMSSVGVTNPPLFIYLLIPMFAINSNPAFVSGCIAVLGLAAVVMTWHIGRKYYSTLVGNVAALFYAVSPWGVIYSRKIWAQDFVPVFAVATMWAMHALVLGKKPKAIFWCLFLPLCVVQIHFSGLALTAAVVLIVAWLRPRIDWRFAVAGLVVALITMAPYLWLQQQTGWQDFKQARNAIGGDKKWEQLNGITTDPMTGYRMPSKENLSYALAIMNGKRIEDVLGISVSGQFDQYQIWTNKSGGGKYFRETLTIGDWPLDLQQLAFIAAFVLAAILAVKGVRGVKVEGEESRRCWILILWVVVPLLVFTVAGLWTYLTYFAILFPVHFIVCGVGADYLARHIKPAAVYAIVAAFAIANIIFMMDYFRFVDAHGGAQGTFGTALGYKQDAARFLAEQGGAKLQRECRLELDIATARTQQDRVELGQKLGQPQLMELGHRGSPELPQWEFPLLITQQPAGPEELPTNEVVMLVDGNREALQPEQWRQLGQLPSTNFGPIKIYFVKR
jgi:hypothetical protein